MTTGVVYLLTGPSHGVRLVVSLWTLRQHYSGNVTVVTTEEVSHAIGKLCASDLRLGVDHWVFPACRLPKNSAFLTKLQFLPHSPYEQTAYLDADTLVTGDISELLAIEHSHPFHATRFAQWVTSGRTIRKRVLAWESVEQTLYSPAEWKALIADSLSDRPAINGGVFAYRRESTLLGPWLDLALAGWQTFICDELALQLLLHRYPHRLLDCRYNCSPIYANSTSDVRIWHLHGEKHLNRVEGRNLWWPRYLECIDQNIARLQDWTPGGDKRLAGFLREYQHHAT